MAVRHCRRWARHCHAYGGKASGLLTLVSVSDSRNQAPRGWVASASSTDFVGTNETIPKSAVTYSASSPAGKVGGGTLASTGEQTLDSPKTVVSGRA